MSPHNQFRLSTQMVLGLIVIALGVLFTLDNLDVLDAREYLRFWPALLIIVGVIKLLQPAGSVGRGWGLALVLVGGLLLLHRLNVVGLYFRDLWPIILIVVGGSLIWGSMSRRRLSGGSDAESRGVGDSVINGTAILGGFSGSNNSQDFRGGELTAVMGGCEVDLRQAAIKGDEAVLEIFAFWGGVSIKIPATWKVVLQGTPILGGFSDETQPSKDPAAKRLVMRGTAIMGGVEITN